MDLTLGKIVESVSVLEKIKEQNPDIYKVKYWIVRNMKILADSFDFFLKLREEIYSKYCNKKITKSNPEGSYFEVLSNGNIIFNLKTESDVAAFNSDMNELYNLPCNDLEPYILSIDDFKDMKNIEVSVDDMFAIDYLLSE